MTDLRLSDPPRQMMARTPSETGPQAVMVPPLADEAAGAAEAAAVAVAQDGGARRPASRHFAMLLMAGALISKLLGFVREVMMAQVVGASLVADGFRGAVTAVLLPLSILQNESVPAILVPMYRQWQRDGETAERLTALTIALTGIALLLMVAVQALGLLWVDAMVGGYAAETKAVTLAFTRVMALAMPASVLLNCLAAGEIALGRSRLTTIRASILNLAVLIGLGILAWTGWIGALAWSFALAFNGLAVCGVWWMAREGLLSAAGARPALVIEAGLAFLRALRPLLAIPVAEQTSVWVERLFASRLVSGTVASIDYARTLTDSAHLLISQPLGLTVLSRGPATDERAQADAIARPVLAIMLPGSVFLVAFAPEIARLVFARGAFNDAAVLLSSEALRGISAGLWAATLGWILIRILNSGGRNAASAGILVAAYAVNILANLGTGLIVPDAWEGPLLLGLGEAARGLTLLIGTTLVLGCTAQVAGRVAVAAVPAGLMGLAAWQIGLAWSGMLPRLAAGSAACAACIGLSLAVTVPSLRAHLWAWIDGRRSSHGNVR